MAPIFHSTWWQIAVPPPWKAERCEECIEITHPEGAGALNISSARKSKGSVLDQETLSQLRKKCPEGTETHRARCGDFVGYSAEYADPAEGIYWKIWFVACRKILLFATYNCSRGEQGLETAQASQLLSSLRCRD